MAQKRILHIIATLGRAGAEKQFVLCTTGLPRGEFDVHACALSCGGPLETDLSSGGIPLTIIGKASKVDPLAYWRLRTLIKRLRPDIVQTWMFSANSWGRAAARAAGVKHLVASELNVDVNKPWHQLAIDRHFGRRSSAVVVNGRGVQQFYQRQGLPADRLRLIYSGVGPVQATTTTRAEILEELGLPPGSRIIGAVGRLWAQKRIEDLIWAADLLKVIRDDTHLLIIGDGPRRQALLRYRRNCHIEDRVHFLGARNDVPRLMPHFDLLWLASGYEGLPNVIMESMSCGLPVVATDIWGNRELVVHGQTGFLVNVGDRGGLARYAHKLLEDSELARRLGAAGQARIAREFNVATMVDKHAELYREIMG